MERNIKQKKRPATLRTKRKVDNPQMISNMKEFCSSCIHTGVQGLLKEFLVVKASTTKPASQLVKTAFDKNKDKNRYKGFHLHFICVRL
ncbi:unnamed protein product [Anisakis simplex]|uniref:40S ribosomal protein S15 n=1 Tax=Anisakis simplex TaxID=6269 RepID=A0A0M3JBM0_ANISI|nr:unnamed protein product [Anisakis simplex]